MLGDQNSAATRNLVINNGDALAKNISNLSSRVTSIQKEFNDRIDASADEINTLAEQIRKLNVQIATVEGGGSSASDAGGLRVQRQQAVDRLSEIAGIKVTEQPSGGDNISINGEYLVFEGQRRQVEVKQANIGGTIKDTIQFSDSKSQLVSSTGELAGLYTARDQIAGTFLDSLDKLSASLIFEFNKQYSQGQGTEGFSQLTSVESVADADAPLENAGLKFTSVNGQFDFIVYNKNQKNSETHTISVHLNGQDNDTTLNSLASQINAIDGVSATVTTGGKLQITSDSPDTQFGFSGDTSGALASLGLNTFFTGSNARNIAVNSELLGSGNDAKFAASSTGFGPDQGTGNAEQLAAFLDKPLDSAGGSTLPDVYDKLVNSVSQGATVAKSVAQGFSTFEGTLNAQLQAVSGVSIDDEAIQLLTLQRIYQASAKFIQTASQLLDVLVQL